MMERDAGRPVSQNFVRGDKRMAKDVRERMVAGATQLLATKGLQATSFSEVIELTNTPRGSIYHHFPGGKDELVLAALKQSCTLMLDGIQGAKGQDAQVVLSAVVDGWRNLLVGHEFVMGCAVSAVTVATESDDLLDEAGRIFGTWSDEMTAAFVEGGLPADRAESFAALVLSTIEGAVVIARAQRSIVAYDRAVELLPGLLDQLR